ncbi:MAG TPA: IPT/TIG domain-containing protein [Thermoanaerobaculia bacterium]|nr:IPT/TIG domain-containing protein [Thermoanaerobaculia bacterium]
MKRLLVVCALFVAIHAFAADPPVVDSIEPNQGRIEGGETVTITGRNFDQGPCDELLGCSFGVTFMLPHPDGCCSTGVATIVSASDTQLVVRTPAHATGLADLTVHARSGLTTTVRGGFRFGREGFRRVLLPAAFSGEVPGAHGSRWVTELNGRVFYPGKLEITRTPFSNPPAQFEGPFRFTDLPAGNNRGAFLYVPEGNFLSLNLRVRDVSREAENFGTEIPIVTENETAAVNAMDFLDIPIGPKYRQTLRMYNFEGRRKTQFGVRILARGGTENLVFTHYETPEEGLEEFPQFPGYIEVNVADLLPAGYEGRVDVSVSHTLGSRVWAMVSVTNNDTQLVTMVTPTFQEAGGVAFVP